jgi:ubiquinone biosynthesis protein COQ9
MSDQDADRLLTQLLPSVPFDGWTEQALTAASRAAGFDEQAWRRIFPRGPLDAVLAFSDWADKAMLVTLQTRDLTQMRVRDRVALGVRARLEALAPHQEAVRRSTRVLTQPGAAPDAARAVYRTVDAIWRAAGDTSTDYNFYTKRGLLAGVVVATTAYWLRDRSPEREASWRFLERRLDEVMRVGKRLAQLKNLGDHLPLPFRRTRRA